MLKLMDFREERSRNPDASKSSSVINVEIAVDRVEVVPNELVSEYLLEFASPFSLDFLMRADIFWFEGTTVEKRSSCIFVEEDQCPLVAYY